MSKAVATDMAALNKHGYEVVSNCLPENRSIRFTLLTLRQKGTVRTLTTRSLGAYISFLTNIS